ncbi:MAG: hypothetical protein QXQ50_10485, partial [Candidatus Bathyarchaeia archaeon]
GRLKVLGLVSGILAFLLCFGAGIWVLSSTGFTNIGLGLYFIGKAFFVGPLLIICAFRAKNE